MIIVVTGLPRSGTTLMMRMLEAGGVPLYYDNSRPVAFKEKGVAYINHNVILRETDKINDLIAGDASWLAECEGKAVKMLTPSKMRIPKDYAYKFIWMDRNVKHMLKSQRKYLKRAKKLMQATQEAVREAKRDGIKMLIGYPESALTIIRFEDILKKPKAVAIRIAQFLRRDLNLDAMVDVVVDRPAYCMPDLMEERMYG